MFCALCGEWACLRDLGPDLFLAFAAAGAVAARETGGHGSLGRAAAAMARPRAMLSPGPPGAAETVAVRTVASKRLAAPARMARTETIGPAPKIGRAHV